MYTELQNLFAGTVPSGAAKDMWIWSGIFNFLGVQRPIQQHAEMHSTQFGELG